MLRAQFYGLVVEVMPKTYVVVTRVWDMPDEQRKAAGVPVGLLSTFNTCLCYGAGATEFTTFPGCLSGSPFIEVDLAGLVFHGRHTGQC